MAAVWSVVAILLGYAVLDVADAAPGALTVRPLPPPPPTETVATRTLPSVPQPTLSTSVAPPLPSLAGDTAAPSAAGIEQALASVRALPALGDAAIGQTFAPDETLRTVVREGDTPDEIVLVAGGDSLLNPGTGDPDAVAGRAGLRDLADQVATALKARGTGSVRLYVDETYAAGPTTAPTWASTFRSSGITGAVAMLGLSSQRAHGGAPGPADPVAAVRAAFARQLEGRGIDVRLAARGQAPGVPGSPMPTPAADGGPSATPSDGATTDGAPSDGAPSDGAQAPTTAAATPNAPASGPGAVLGSV